MVQAQLLRRQLLGSKKILIVDNFFKVDRDGAHFNFFFLQRTHDHVGLNREVSTMLKERDAMLVPSFVASYGQN